MESLNMTEESEAKDKVVSDDGVFTVSMGKKILLLINMNLLDLGTLPVNSTVPNPMLTHLQVTVGPSDSAAGHASTKPMDENGSSAEAFVPPVRMNAGVAVKRGMLYLYGGMCEDSHKQLTLNDFYSLGEMLRFCVKPE